MGCFLILTHAASPIAFVWKEQRSWHKKTEAGGWSWLHHSAHEADLYDIHVKLCCYSPDAHTAEM